MSFSQLFMFIPFLKTLTAETDSGEIARIEKILTEHKIPYRVQTTSSRGTIGRTQDAMSYKSYNIAPSKFGYSISVSYVIYVWKKDLARAKDLISK